MIIIFVSNPKIGDFLNIWNDQKGKKKTKSKVYGVESKWNWAKMMRDWVKEDDDIGAVASLHNGTILYNWFKRYLVKWAVIEISSKWSSFTKWCFRTQKIYMNTYCRNQILVPTVPFSQKKRWAWGLKV